MTATINWIKERARTVLAKKADEEAKAKAQEDARIAQHLARWQELRSLIEELQRFVTTLEGKPVTWVYERRASSEFYPFRSFEQLNHEIEWLRMRCNGYTVLRLGVTYDGKRYKVGHEYTTDLTFVRDYIATYLAEHYPKDFA